MYQLFDYNEDSLNINYNLNPLQEKVTDRKLVKSGKRAKEPLKCDDCQREFLYTDGVKKHKLLKNCPALRTNHCSKCPKSFETDEELKEHIEMRHEPKELFCKFCEMSFKPSQTKPGLAMFRLERHFYTVQYMILFLAASIPFAPLV